MRSASKLAALVELLKERGEDPEELRRRALAFEPLSPEKDTKKEPEVMNLDGRFEEAARQGENWVEAGSQRSGQRPASGPDARAAQRQQQQQRGAAAAPASTLEQVVARQSLLLEQALSLKQNPRSTIKVEPRVTWPKLGDDGPGGKEVQEFYERLEEIFALANNGQGMSSQEQLVALKNCLQGSRKVIYENVYKSAKNPEGVVEDHQKVYDAIKKRPMI